MAKFCLILILYLFASPVFSTEFKLASFNRYGSAPSLELWLYPSNANKLNNIFKVLTFSREKLYVRLIGESSEFTNNELLSYYKSNVAHLAENLDSNTNETKSNFINAFMSTTLFKNLKQKLNENGFKIINISFEKLNISKNTITIPDVYIECSKENA